jgi:hypothetical protein
MSLYIHISIEMTRLFCSTLFLQIWCRNDSCCILKWSSYFWHWSTAGDRECWQFHAVYRVYHCLFCNVLGVKCLIKYESIMYTSLFIVLLCVFCCSVFLVQRYNTPNAGKKQNFSNSYIIFDHHFKKPTFSEYSSWLQNTRDRWHETFILKTVKSHVAKKHYSTLCRH